MMCMINHSELPTLFAAFSLIGPQEMFYICEDGAYLSQVPLLHIR